jgi:hypothetical protein
VIWRWLWRKKDRNGSGDGWKKLRFRKIIFGYRSIVIYYFCS